jgi:hypothetical protein
MFDVHLEAFLTSGHVASLANAATIFHNLAIAAVNCGDTTFNLGIHDKIVYTIFWQLLL